MTGAVRDRSRATAALTGLAAAGTVGAGALVAGTPGIVAGGALVVAWLLVPPVFVVALGQLLFAALLPADAPLVAFAVVEAPLVAMVLADVTDRRAPLRTFGGGVAALVAFGALAVAGAVWLDSLWTAAALLVCAAAVAAYALHRYTVVTVEITDEF